MRRPHVTGRHWICIQFVTQNCVPHCITLQMLFPHALSIEEITKTWTKHWHMLALRCRWLQRMILFNRMSIVVYLLYIYSIMNQDFTPLTKIIDEGRHIATIEYTVSQ